MSADPAVWWEGDGPLVDGALREARRAGVPEAEIQEMLHDAASGPQDELVVPVLVGRLGTATMRRGRGVRRPTGPPAWAPKDDDDG